MELRRVINWVSEVITLSFVQAFTGFLAVYIGF